MDSLLSLRLYFPVCSVDTERERQKEHYVGATLWRAGDCFEGDVNKPGKIAFQGGLDG